MLYLTGMMGMSGTSNHHQRTTCSLVRATNSAEKSLPSNVGAVNDEVEISLLDGQKIVAVVTHSSTESLGLAVGVDAFALIKASWVILLTDTAGVRLSARNQLAGTVEKVVPGAVNAEVILKLGSGDVIVAIVTSESVSTLGLVAGKVASAAFKASSVIIGVKA